MVKLPLLKVIGVGMCVSDLCLPTSAVHPGIPPAPKSATISAIGPTWVVLTISITASGAGATGSFMIRVVSTDTNLYVNQSFPFPKNVGAQVTVNITNLREGAQYFFSVYASDVYGTSDPVTVRVNLGSKYTHTQHKHTWRSGSFLNDTSVSGTIILLYYCL